MSVRSQTFNPLQFSLKSILPVGPDRTEEKFEEIVTKGGNKIIKVDIDHFDKLCKSFRNKAHLKIKNLTGKDKDDFNLMVSYVHFLYGTSYYNTFYKKVEKHFSNLKEITVGTVGGYFAGCLNTASNSFDAINQTGCSAICAGAIPRPKGDEGWSFCDRAVIFADKNKNGYSFNFLKEAESEEELDNVYLFLEHTDIDDFKGFTKTEKNELRKMGVENVHVVGCDEKGTKYVDLYSSIDVENIKERKSKKSSYLFIIFLIFLLVLLILIYWNYNIITSHF